MKNLFVGNLPFAATEEGIRELFEQFGEVQQAKIMTDRETGKSRGFGFVEMVSDEDAEKAIAALNGKDFQGRSLTVNEARPKPERGGGGGGFGGKSKGGRGGFGRGPREPREPRW